MPKLEGSLLSGLNKAVINFDSEQLIILCNEYLASGSDVNKAVFEGLIPGMLYVSKLYEEQVYFIPEMLLCAETLYIGLEIFQPHMKSSLHVTKAKVLIGVVEGDIHDIGKNLVKLLLSISGFEVIDLGRDVPSESFVKEAVEGGFDLVCMSSMMSTTACEMKNIIQEIKYKKPELKIIVGGAPVTKFNAIDWQADGYAPDAEKALAIIKQLLNFC